MSEKIARKYIFFKWSNSARKSIKIFWAPNFNHKLTRPKLFQMERFRFMHLLSFASLLVFASEQKVTPQKLITTYPDLTVQEDSEELK